MKKNLIIFFQTLNLLIVTIANCNLKSLEILALNNNKNKELPVSIRKLKRIQSLHLSKNKLDELPKMILELDALKLLDLTGNNLGNFHELYQTLELLKNKNKGIIVII